MGNVDVDKKMIAVGDDVKQNYFQPQGRRRGGSTAAAKLSEGRQHKSSGGGWRAAVAVTKAVTTEQWQQWRWRQW